MRDAPALLDANGVSDRVTIETGDFFKSVAAGGDAYILSHIIHDWNEDQCLTILGHVRKAMNPAGRLLIVEMVIAAGDAPHRGKMLDMTMLVQLGDKNAQKPNMHSFSAKPAFTLRVWFRPIQP